MIVQIILITLGFVVALSYPIGIEPLRFLPTNLSNALISASAILLLSIGYILLGVWLVRRQIRNNLNHYYRQLFNYRLLLLAVYFAQIYIFHLPILISGAPGFISLGIGQIPFVTNFLILTPFLLTLVLSYIPFYWIEKFIYKAQSSGARPNDQMVGQATGSPSLANFLAFQIRTYFMLGILPLLFFLFALETIHAIQPLHNVILIYPFIEWLISILLLLAMYIFAPFALKYLWVTKPLPEGSLRIFLKSIAFRANIKIRDFLIWEVGRRPFVNALLIGIFPFNRFVIFTDSIIKNLSDDEIAAVFAHEVGHAKFNHLLLLLLFTMAYLSILFSLSGVIDRALGNLPEWLGQAGGIWNLGFSLTLIMVFWLVLFGQLSRRFELQADWFAAQITADPDSFTRALTKIAYLNGIPLRTSGMSALTHPSIDKRITSIGNRDAFASAQTRTMKKVIAILTVSICLALTGVGYTIIQEIKSAPQRQVRIQAWNQAEQGRLILAELEHKPYTQLSNEDISKIQTGISYINQAIASDPGQSYYYFILGAAYEHLGPECDQASQLNYQKAYELEPTDPTERYYLSKKLNQ